MKRICLLFFILIPCFAYSEGMSLDLGVADFYLDTKIMDDGSITNVGLRIKYDETWGGEIRGKSEKTAKNEEMDASGVADSLIATNETVYELSLLPLQYRSAINQDSQWRVGAGLFYEYKKSNQKGFIDMPRLEDFGFARINSYKEDFSMHVFGPLADIGILFNSEKLVFNLSGGVVPVFYLTASEKQRLYPLFDTVSHSQNVWGSPYFYLYMNSTFFRYINLAARYEYSKLKYDVIDFDADFNPLFPKSTTVNQSIFLEASAILPFKSLGMGLQVGYGYLINIYTIDSGNPITKNKPYFIISGKLLGFNKPEE